MATTLLDRTTREATTVAVDRRRRHDIDGLRFLAIALVVVYHVWFGKVSGGVDVFLLISAFFLTDAFVRRMEARTRPDLGRFLSRRFARLLPAAAVTIAGVLAFAYFAMPPSTWSSLWSQSWASLFYYQNWQLAADSVDYYARDEALPSLLQHFWSLSVQGQVFVLWPLLLVAIAFVTRRFALRPRVVAGWVFGAVFAASLVYSVVTTLERQEFAYFDTGARLWEFALGSLAAIALPFIRPGRILAAVLGWVGVVGLVSTGFVFDVGAGFPGYIALWPTLSAVMIIAAGQSTHPGVVSRILGSTPFRRAGLIAYSLYLVHWPMLIGYMALTGETQVDLVGGLIIVGLSVATALVLWALVERPLQSRPLAGSNVLTILAAALVVIVPLATWQIGERARAAQVQTLSNPGAAVLLADAVIEIDEDAQRLPFGWALDDEWVGLGDRCTGAVRPATPIVRDSCMRMAGADADAPRVLVVGDSHAEQWMGALIPLAEERGWDMIALLRGGCTFADPSTSRSGPQCREWQRDVLDYADHLQPDVVVTMGTRSEVEGDDERVPRGLRQAIDTLRSSGSEVVLLRDNPRFDEDMFECLERQDDGERRCARDAGDVLAPLNPARNLAGDGVHVVDLTPYLCPDGVCLPEIGNVAVYMDDNHLTWTYARTLAPAMEDALAHLEILR